MCKIKKIIIRKNDYLVIIIKVINIIIIQTITNKIVIFKYNAFFSLNVIRLKIEFDFVIKLSVSYVLEYK